MPLPFHKRTTGLLLVTLLFTWAANAATLKTILIIPGAAVDKTPLGETRGGANVNRLGGFGSDIYYDRFANVFYGLTDRGPGGGTIRFATRVQKFTLDIDPVSGVAGNFNLIATIPFTIPAGKTVNGIAGPGAFNGIDPMSGSADGTVRNVGLSHSSVLWFCSSRRRCPTRIRKLNLWLNRRSKT